MLPRPPSRNLDTNIRPIKALCGLIGAVRWRPWRRLGEEHGRRLGVQPGLPVSVPPAGALFVVRGACIPRLRTGSARVGREHRSHVHEHMFAYTVQGTCSDLNTV